MSAAFAHIANGIEAAFFAWSQADKRDQARTRVAGFGMMS
jgi:hypothetical protein